jgi:hypothetical protein
MAERRIGERRVGNERERRGGTGARREQSRGRADQKEGSREGNIMIAAEGRQDSVWRAQWREVHRENW